MRKYLALFFFSWILIALSCQHKATEPSCPDCGKKVDTISNRPGTVGYDSTTARYYVSMHVPGTIDSFIVGYVCELPAPFAQVGKRVVLSGTFFETSLPYSGLSRVCCVDGAYCLTLSSIKEP